MNISALTPSQKECLSTWVEEGADLNALQKRAEEELGLKMTFMDMRFLVLDLGLEIKAKPAPAASSLIPPSDSNALPQASTPQSAQKVQISMDESPAEGSALSGQVIFPSGAKGAWFFDHDGRLGLDPSPSSPDPTEDDIDVFQRELKHFLRTELGGL